VNRPEKNNINIRVAQRKDAPLYSILLNSLQVMRKSWIRFQLPEKILKPVF